VQNSAITHPPLPKAIPEGYKLCWPCKMKAVRKSVLVYAISKEEMNAKLLAGAGNRTIVIRKNMSPKKRKEQ
jgi:hypothetical protein